MDKVFVGYFRQELERAAEHVKEDICHAPNMTMETYSNLRGQLKGIEHALDTVDEFIESYEQSQNEED